MSNSSVFQRSQFKQIKHSVLVGREFIKGQLVWRLATPESMANLLMRYFHSVSIYWEKWSCLNQLSPDTGRAGVRQRGWGWVLDSEWPVRDGVLPQLEPHSALVAAFWGATALRSLGRGGPIVTRGRAVSLEPGSADTQWMCLGWNE